MNRLSKYKIPIKKLLLNHFGAALLGIMLSSACGLNFTLTLITSIFAAVFYMIICYNAMWDLGAKDRVRVGGEVYDRFYGLKATLFANIPNIIIAFLNVIFTALGALAKIQFFANAAFITNVISRFWHGMYTGIIVYIIPHTTDGQLVEISSMESVLYMLLYFAILIPSFVVCPLAYKMGYKGVRIIPEKKKENK